MIRNKRLASIFEKAVRMNVGGGYWPLDAYNQKVVTDDVLYTITARTYGDNNHFLMEVYEGCDTDTTGDQAGIY